MPETTGGLALTVVAGVLVMNLDHLPGVHFRDGFRVVGGIVLAVEGALIGLFRKKGCP